MPRAWSPPAFVREGIKTVLDARVTRVDHRAGSSVRTVIVEQHGRLTVDTEAVLVATGRAPNLEGLDLRQSRHRVDPSRRWTIDSAPAMHASGRWETSVPAKFRTPPMPWHVWPCRMPLFFGRRIAHALVIQMGDLHRSGGMRVGISAEDAAKRPTYAPHGVTGGQRPCGARWPNEGSRAYSDARGRILGALVASHAGEMIGEMSLAMTADVTLGTLAHTIHPYPTQSEAWEKKLGDAWNPPDSADRAPFVRSLASLATPDARGPPPLFATLGRPARAGHAAAETLAGTDFAGVTRVHLGLPIATYSGMLTGACCGALSASAPTRPLCAGATHSWWDR